MFIKGHEKENFVQGSQMMSDSQINDGYQNKDFQSYQIGNQDNSNRSNGGAESKTRDITLKQQLLTNITNSNQQSNNSNKFYGQPNGQSAPQNLKPMLPLSNNTIQKQTNINTSNQQSGMLKSSSSFMQDTPISKKGSFLGGQNNNGATEQTLTSATSNAPGTHYSNLNESPNLENSLNNINQSQSMVNSQSLSVSRISQSIRQSINVDNLIKICSKKLQSDPHHKKAIFIRASSYMKKAMYQEALDDCNKLLEIDERNVGAYFIRGCALEQKGLIDEAIQDFNIVLEFDPYHVNAVFARAACQNRQGDFIRAIEDYQRALELDGEKQNQNQLSNQRQRRLLGSRLLNHDSASKSSMSMLKDSRVDNSANMSQLDPQYYSEQQQQQQMMMQNQVSLFQLGSTSDNFTQSQNGNNVNRRQGGDLEEQEDLVKPNENQMNFLQMDMMTYGGAGKMNVDQKGQGPQNVKLDFSQDKSNQQQKFISAQPGANGKGMLMMNSGGGTSSNSNFKRNSSNGSLQGTMRSNCKMINDDQVSFSSDMNTSNVYRAQNSDKQQYSLNNTPSAGSIQSGSGTSLSQVDGNDQKSQAEWYHIQGFEARKRGDFRSAIEFYTLALEMMPRHFKAHFNRGFAFDKCGQYDAAIADYTKALEIEPMNAYAYYNRGISLDRKNDYDQAIKNFTVAISLDPKKADFYHNRAFAYRKKKFFDLAIEDYTIAIQLDPKHFQAYYNRAFCYDQMGQFQKAEEDYSIALSLQPTNINVLYHFGCLLEQMGEERLKDALACFNEAISQDESYAPAYNARGLVLDKMNQYETAFENFTKSIEFDPENPVFIHNRACCLRNMGRLDEAIEDFQTALQYDNSNPIIYSNIGLVWRKLECFENAIQCYTQEIKYSSESTKPLNNRAYCYAQMKLYKEAVDDYTRTIELDNHNIHALHNRGICFERMGQYRKAIEDFTNVINLNQDNANAYFNRGCCYDSIGELDLAISDYSTALEIDSQNNNNNSTNPNSNGINQLE